MFDCRIENWDIISQFRAKYDIFPLRRPNNEQELENKERINIKFLIGQFPIHHL